MTDTLTATGSRADIDGRLERLLRDHPPATTDPKAFWGAQYDLGLAWVHFPVGLGGLGTSPDLQEVVDARLDAAGAPANLLHNFVGLGMAAPVIVAFGTDEQKQRFLRPLFTCEEVWCQMFSEPTAGSDLASLATTAARDGDEWVINGHKVWTTMAHIARWGILVARSDTDAPKHRGLTYFVCDMTAPGVEVRPLRQITGEAEFNEVIMTDLVLPDSLRLGDVGDGWRVTLATLMNERMHNSESAKRPAGSGPIRHAVRLWRERAGDHTDPVRRDKLMKLWVEAEIIRLTSLRAGQMREQGTPGPEGSILKLPIGEFPQRLFDFCLELKGPYGTLIENYEMTQPTIMSNDTLGDEADPDMAKAFLNTRSHTIGGGTSEMQRNTIGERVLGLPPEPKVDKDTPWSQLRRN
jgi:alkylation response protein AidB-like acyl-CoA dehydrogenase